MLGLRTVIYMVNDVAKAKEWYSELFQTQPYFDTPYYVGFNVGGYELGLHPEKSPTTAKPETVLAYWGVDDMEATYQRMLELGAVAHENPTNVGGDIVVAAAKDPWGNIIGIIYNPLFKLP